jgi:hypothetical protein
MARAKELGRFFHGLSNPLRYERPGPESFGESRMHEINHHVRWQFWKELLERVTRKDVDESHKGKAK